MSADRYVLALSSIPHGRTATFGDLARLAGRPTGARAAGRAVALVPSDDPRPWHRAVRADGGLAPEPARAAAQLERLRAEDARPRASESTDAWLARRGASAVGDWRTRKVFERGAPGIAQLDPALVEALADVAEARERGFGARERPARAPRSAKGRRDGRRDAPRAFEPSLEPLEEALDALDWDDVRTRLWRDGAAVLPAFASVESCAFVRGLFDDQARHERSIDMAPRGFGRGTYRYLREPVPELVARLRERLYRELAPLARRHPRNDDLPARLEAFHERCVRAGQARGACIVLRYPEGGVNHPHRDVYGKVAFPYQAVLVASARGEDFQGAEFVLRERASGDAWSERAFPLGLGDLCLFPTRARALEQGGRVRWIDVEHGMRTVLLGERTALGVVFHLAE